MKDKLNWKLPAVVAGVVIVALLGLWAYLRFFSSTTPKGSEVSETRVIDKGALFLTATPSPVDVEYDEVETVVTVGTKGVLRGSFQKAEGGEIFLEDGGAVTRMPLTDEVVLICTKQNLSNATEIDYNEATDVNVVAPSELGDRLSSLQPVVIFSQEVDGILKTHSIAVAASTCN